MRSAESFSLEESGLHHLTWRARAQLERTRARESTLRLRVRRDVAADALWLTAQGQLLVQQRALDEQASLQQLAICLADLRRWHDIRRTLHDRACTHLRRRRDGVQGNLHWRVFCARLEHDTHRTLAAEPLSGEQLRACKLVFQQQLPSRAISHEGSRQQDVERAAVVSETTSGGSASPRTARSLRGLICDDFCNTHGQFELMLRRACATVTISRPFGQSSASRGAEEKEHQPKSPSPAHALLARVRPWAPAPERNGGGGDDTPGVMISPAEERMPLFPLSMRLNSDCLGWMHATPPAAAHRHLFFVVGEDATKRLPIPMRGSRATAYACSFVGGRMMQRLAACSHLVATGALGADLRIQASEGPSGSDREPLELRLRPATVENLLAVECLWQSIDDTDRRALSASYTWPIASQQRLTTLYAPLESGACHSSKNGRVGHGCWTYGNYMPQQLRPLRPFELSELLRVYVLRSPLAPLAALALPRALIDGSDTLQHVYCSLTQTAGGCSASECLILQIQGELPMENASGDTGPVHLAQLGKMLHDGSLHGALLGRGLARIISSETCFALPQQAELSLCVLQDQQHF